MCSPELIREHYDSLAFVYRAFWGDHIHHGLFDRGEEDPATAQVNMLEHCAALVRLQADAHSALNCFDVGCGHGGTSVFLASHFGCRVDALTLSPKQAELARENAKRTRVNDSVRIMVGDAETWPFPVEHYDLIWTMESSEHFADKARYVANAARALKRGGKLLIAAWTGSMQDANVRAVARAFVCPELWTSAQYRDAMSQNGLTISAGEDLTPRVTRTWEICRERARLARPLLRLFPGTARELADGIDVILNAYRSGELTYSVIVGERS